METSWWVEAGMEPLDGFAFDCTGMAYVEIILWRAGFALQIDTDVRVWCIAVDRSDKNGDFILVFLPGVLFLVVGELVVGAGGTPALLSNAGAV